MFPLFKIGDEVVYTPSLRGRDLLVMTDFAQLVPKNHYIIVGIDDFEYLILKGFENCIPRSIHWSEFSPI